MRPLAKNQRPRRRLLLVGIELELVEDDSALRLEVVQDFWRREVAGGALSPLLAEALLQAKDSPETWAGILSRHMARPCARVLWDESTSQGGDEGADGSAGLAQAEANLTRAYAAARGLAGVLQAANGCVNDALGGLNASSYKPESVAKAVTAPSLHLGQAVSTAVEAATAKSTASWGRAAGVAEAGPRSTPAAPSQGRRP